MRIKSGYRYFDTNRRHNYCETYSRQYSKLKARTKMTDKNQIRSMIRDLRSEMASEDAPLSGIRIIDMGTVIAGPFACTFLGDFGAEIIKIENPDGIEAIRTWGALGDGFQPFWCYFGRNKLPITLNLKSEGGRKILYKLIRESDVLIENMRPGAMEKLGLKLEAFKRTNPGLIVGRVSGYGQDGPYSGRPAFGTLAEGFSGFTFLNAHPNGKPTNPPLALADFITGLHLAITVLIALRNQKRNHYGWQVIDVSLYEPLFSLFGADFLAYCLTGEEPMPKGNELSYVAPRNNFRTRDGRWITLSCSAQKPFERLMDAIGKPEMKNRPEFRSNAERIKPEHRRVLNSEISGWIERRDLDEVLEICDNLGITAGPIFTMNDILRNAHYAQRKSYVEKEELCTGKKLMVPDVPVRMSETPGKYRFFGLPRGCANEVVLGDLLGFSNDQIDDFKKRNVI